MNRAVVDSSSSTSSEAATESSEAESTSDMEMRSPEDTRLRRHETRWKRYKYLDCVPRSLYKQEREAMARHAARFEAHLSRQTPHYALDEATRRELPGQMECVALHIEEHQRACLVKEAGETYLVRRSHHYIYSFLIDLALRPPNEPKAVRQQRRAHLKQKTRRIHFCRTEHANNDRCCPLEWVLYTRRSGDLGALLSAPDGQQSLY